MAENRDIPTAPAANDSSPVAGGLTDPSAEEARHTSGLAWRLAFSLLLILAAAIGFYSAFRLPAPETAEAPPAVDKLLSPGPERGVPKAQTEPSQQVPLDPLIPDTSAELIEEGKRVADDLVRRFPNSPDAHEMLARFHFEFADVERATAAWRRCLELNPAYAYAHAGLAKAAAKRGEQSEAVGHYRRAVLADPLDVAHQIELGRALLSAGQIDEAEVVLQRAVQAAPGGVEGHAELGAVQLQKRDQEAAKASFEAAIRLDPNYAPAHSGLAAVYARLGDTARAREHEAQLKELRSQHRDVQQQQRAVYDDKEALNEDISRRYTEMAAVYLTGGQAAAAEQLLQRAARMHAANAECRKALAWLFLQQNDRAGTIRMLRDLAQLEPANASYPAEIARLYGEMNRLDDAERTLREFIRSEPQNATGQRVMADYYLNLRFQPKAAVEHAKQAAELSGAAEDWVFLSTACEAAGDVPGAIAALERAVQIAPDNLQYRQLLALLKDDPATRSADDADSKSPADRPQDRSAAELHQASPED